MLHNVVSCHHEFLDGSGYPRKLKGDDIPLEARIITVSDIFDALTSRRPYKEGWSNDLAFGELCKMAEQGKLDGECVKALMDSPDEVLDVQRRFGDQVEEPTQAEGG